MKLDLDGLHYIPANPPEEEVKQNRKTGRKEDKARVCHRVLEFMAHFRETMAGPDRTANPQVVELADASRPPGPDASQDSRDPRPR